MSKVPDILLETKGIVLAPASLLRAKGSLLEAINVNVDAPGVIRTRQGFARQANGFGGPVWKMVSTKELAGNLLINFGTGTTATGLKLGDGSGAPVTVTGGGGGVVNTPEARMRCAVGRRNHYLTSGTGMSRLETSLTLYRAGQARGLGLDLTGPAAVLVGAPGTMLPDGSAVAYRTTINRYDGEHNLMEGAPSSRTVVYNKTGTTGWAAGVTKNVTVRALLPKENGTTTTALTTSHFLRVYRSLDVASGEPFDDMRLVFEAFLAAGDITNGYVEFTDSTPNSFRQLSPALYTNANDFGEDGVGGPGIEQANEPPPVCTDVALFQKCLFMGDLTYKHALEFTVLSVVAATGLTVGDTLTIAGVTYTSVAGAPANNQFNISAAATVSEAIARTAQNLVEAINKSTTNTLIYAFYVSTAITLPGWIRLETRDFGGAFTAAASAHGAAGYRPSLAAAVASTSKVIGGGLAFSKPYQPDACPAVNFLPVGRDDTHILALQVLGDSLFVFTDDGLYRLYGTSFLDWDLRKFTPGGEFILMGRELVVECDGALYAVGLTGIARITESSLDYISTSIEPLLLKIYAGTTIDWMRANGWAVAYRTQHKVVFALPSGTSDRNCAFNLVYDVRMQAWTRWDFPREASSSYGRCAGCVRFNDQLLFLSIWNGAGTDAWVFREVRTYAATDYADVNEAGATVAISKTVKWNVLTASPVDAQLFDEFFVFFDGPEQFAAWTTPTSLAATFSTEFDSKVVTLSPATAARTSRTLVPQSMRRGTRIQVQLVHSVTQQYFGLEGGALILEASGTTRTGSK